MRRLRLMLVALLLVPFAANADLIGFSYDTGAGVLTGTFEGQVQADGDTVFVTAVFGPVQIDGVDAFELPFVGYAPDYNSTFAGVGRGIVSFSGSQMEIIACDTDGCGRGFAISVAQGVYATGGLGRFGPYIPERWNLTAIPEPGTLALFGIGLIGLGLARRRQLA